MIRLLNFLALFLFAASLLLQNPLLFLLAALLALVALTTALWGQYALAGVTYKRHLGAARMFVGEETDLWVEIVNAKPLPLAWLKANDEFPAEIELVKGTLHFTHKQTRRMLTNLFSLRFYERVRKQYRVRATQRGAFEFGPVELSSGDMFGLRTQHQEIAHTDLLIVYPRVVPVTALGLPAAHPFGDAKMTRKIAEDPLRLMSVRAYAVGDSTRFIHWKATARRGALQTKVFEPSAQRMSAIFLDAQTVPFEYQGFVPEYLEFAITVAASIVRYLLDAREAVGLYANASRRNESEMVKLAPSRRPAQWFEILDTLAWLNYLTTTPLAKYLRAEIGALPFGATVIAISAVITNELVAALLDAQRTGHPTALIAISESAPENIPDALQTYWIGGRGQYGKLADLKF
ncbi:MAG: DUF58 domain-containing protein [Chloroflexi bacterium]|nr:DUF58 domain-containing protein [Chloroflexota bacterium]